MGFKISRPFTRTRVESCNTNRNLRIGHIVSSIPFEINKRQIVQNGINRNKRTTILRNVNHILGYRWTNVFLPLNLNGIRSFGRQINDINVVRIKRIDGEGFNFIRINHSRRTNIGLVCNSVKNSLPTENINGIVDVGRIDDVFWNRIND